MNNYSKEFINIDFESLELKQNHYDIFSRYASVSMFNNFESYFVSGAYNHKEIALATKPYIKFTDNYFGFNELFHEIDKNTSNFYAKISIRQLDFTYRVSLYDEFCVITFNVKNNRAKSVEFDFLLSLKAFFDYDAISNRYEVKKLDAEFNDKDKNKNYAVYQIKKADNDRAYYVVTNRGAVSYNQDNFNIGKINYEKENDILYLNHILSIKSGETENIKTYLISSHELLKKFLYLGESDFLVSNIAFPDFSFEEYSNNNEFDNLFSSLCSDMYSVLYEAYQTGKNYYQNLLLFVGFNDTIDDNYLNTNSSVIDYCLEKLNILLKIYSTSEISYNYITESLLSAVSNNLNYYTFDNLILIVDLYENILRLDKNYPLYAKCTAYNKSLRKIIKSVDFEEIFHDIEKNKSERLITAFARCKEYIGTKLYKLFTDYLSKIGYLTTNYSMTFDYYLSLYYLYDADTKDAIYNRIVSNTDKANTNIILRIIFDKMLGYTIEYGAVKPMPNLPLKLDKVVLNHRFNRGIYTLIAKRTGDYYSVNDNEFKRAVKVKLKDGYAKIISSSK